MPEVFRYGGFRFFFFSREGTEPRHVHVEQADRYAKFWLNLSSWWNLAACAVSTCGRFTQ